MSLSLVCCTCVGSCNHTGGHVYCALHGGVGWGVAPAPRPCEHCFCVHRPLQEPPHVECCMCHTRRVAR